MKRPAGILFTACLATIAAGAAVTMAAEVGAQEQDLVNVKASKQVKSAVWKKTPDSLTLQIVLNRTRYAVPATRPEPLRQTRTVNVADALLPLVPVNAGTYMPVQFADRPQPDDRGAAFIANTIANLRDLNPDFACSKAITPGSPAMRFPNADKPGERRVEIWLLNGDGTHIQPAAYSCDAPGPESRDRTDISISYRFSAADGAQAVASAIRIDDEFFIENLQPLRTAPTAP